MTDKPRSAIDAGRAARRALRLASKVDPPLTGRELRVLNAVVAFTALYSRLHDRVYLAQLAAFAFGVDEAKPWMLKRTREALLVLQRHGLVHCQPPRGRPNQGTGGPAYLVVLPAEVTLDTGSVSPGSDPAHGVHSEEKVTPILDRNGPRSWGKSDPAPRGPTERLSVETSRACPSCSHVGTDAVPVVLNGSGVFCHNCDEQTPVGVWPKSVVR